MQNLSNQQTLQQQRAASAFQQVDGINDKKYGSLARSLPAMIQIDGLGHALAFLKAKGAKERHFIQLYNHVEEWLKLRFGFGNQDLLKWVIEQNSNIYRQVTSEALSYLLWIRRFVEAKGLTEDQQE
ncbi:MAG: type III-B CRISPR module-associated protein Cmr5 [Chloroflexi bacterium]|nr:type III-B CRISPR module-associated protein Cmr5 [Chloroflexota bacterium]